MVSVARLRWVQDCVANGFEVRLFVSHNAVLNRSKATFTIDPNKQCSDTVSLVTSIGAVRLGKAQSLVVADAGHKHSHGISTACSWFSDVAADLRPTEKRTSQQRHKRARPARPCSVTFQPDDNKYLHMQVDSLLTPESETWPEIGSMPDAILEKIRLVMLNVVEEVLPEFESSAVRTICSLPGLDQEATDGLPGLLANSLSEVMNHYTASMIKSCAQMVATSVVRVRLMPRFTGLERAGRPTSVGVGVNTSTSPSS
eukprot:TRINITY_DN92843_c0_g1_i1.p1 TRINITY_DN92843_c0_g1~~TRINITY_DN92843_c0_g1_i1.p1  ORF type:complete len:257 (-),score=16.13 TRINITY_DN92843_c0_g1_i1:104-874(-)